MFELLQHKDHFLLCTVSVLILFYLLNLFEEVISLELNLGKLLFILPETIF